MELRPEPPGKTGTRAIAGFTLVELMMTILIAAILMAAAVPMMRGAIASSRLSSQTNEIVAALTLARSQAITQNQQVTFCRTSSNETVANPVCSASAGNWQFWIVRTSAGTVVRRGAKVASSLEIRASSLTNDRVTFGSDGLARSNNVLLTGGPHITVCSNHSTTDNKRRITLGAGSRVSTAVASGAICP